MNFDAEACLRQQSSSLERVELVQLPLHRTLLRFFLPEQLDGASNESQDPGNDPTLQLLRFWVPTVVGIQIDRLLPTAGHRDGPSLVRKSLYHLWNEDYHKICKTLLQSDAGSCYQ